VRVVLSSEITATAPSRPAPSTSLFPPLVAPARQRPRPSTPLWPSDDHRGHTDPRTHERRHHCDDLGSNFVGTVLVRFGEKRGTAVRVLSSSEVTVTAPPGSGTVYVTRPPWWVQRDKCHKQISLLIPCRVRRTISALLLPIPTARRWRRPHQRRSTRGSVVWRTAFATSLISTSSARAPTSTRATSYSRAGCRKETPSNSRSPWRSERASQFGASAGSPAGTAPDRTRRLGWPCPTPTALDVGDDGPVSLAVAQAHRSAGSEARQGTEQRLAPCQSMGTPRGYSALRAHCCSKTAMFRLSRSGPCHHRWVGLRARDPWEPLAWATVRRKTRGSAGA